MKNKKTLERKPVPVFEKRTFRVSVAGRDFLYTCNGQTVCIDAVASMFPGRWFSVTNEQGKTIYPYDDVNT